MENKKVAIIGSTGSIGTQALDVAREQQDLNIVSLACGSNIDLLFEQISEFRPHLAAVSSMEDAQKLQKRLSEADINDCKVSWGIDGLIECAVVPEADIVLTAVVGMIGIRPTIAAIEAGKDIALANKETLVCAGHIIMPLAKKCGVRILPVDSEHSAIFQSLQGNEGNHINKIILTCSGGPFRGKSLEDLEKVTVEDALAHPNWAMGKKITIDSATMINKGLEVMEASHLFGVPASRIEVVVHPQSVIHSAVEYDDGGVMAELGVPDMRLPIQYALYYPERRPMSGKRLSLTDLGSLTFEEPDLETFYGLALAVDAFEAGGNVPTVFNAANEKAVAMFLNGKTGFLGIMDIITECIQSIEYIDNPSVDDILRTEKLTYEYIEENF